MIGTLSFSAPLGDDAFGTGANDLSLGSGFWGVSGNLNAVKAYDPAVLFGSLGYAHYFERSILGNRFQPGESISYTLGMGMAMNDEITLSAALIGAYQFDTRINGQRAPRTSFEPILLRLAVTITALKCHIVEPFVRLGMTDDASNASFGVIITRMFH